MPNTIYVQVCYIMILGKNCYNTLQFKDNTSQKGGIRQLLQ